MVAVDQKQGYYNAVQQRKAAEANVNTITAAAGYQSEKTGTQGIPPVFQSKIDAANNAKKIAAKEEFFKGCDYDHLLQKRQAASTNQLIYTA